LTLLLMETVNEKGRTENRKKQKRKLWVWPFPHAIGGVGKEEIIAVAAYGVHVPRRRGAMEILTNSWLRASKGGWHSLGYHKGCNLNAGNGNVVYFVN